MVTRIQGIVDDTRVFTRMKGRLRNQEADEGWRERLIMKRGEQVGIDVVEDVTVKEAQNFF